MKYLRAALVAAAILATALGATSVRAAEPTIGASVSNVVYTAESRDIVVRSRSVDADVTVTFAPEGSWSVEPATMTLKPGETGHATLVGDDADGRKVTVVVTYAGEVPAGESRTALSFTATILHERPFDWGAAARTAAMALLGLAGLGLLLRRTKPWQLRLGRVA